MNACDHISQYLMGQLINSQTHLIIQFSVLVLLSLKDYNFLLAITEYHLNTCNDSLGKTLCFKWYIELNVCMKYTRCIIITSFNYLMYL